MSAEQSSDGDLEGFGRPPLPRGRHRLTPEQVAANQRKRLVAAMASSVAERGYSATSVERVIDGARVSRGTFYEHFANKGECLLAAHEDIFGRLMERISAAIVEQNDWTGKVRAAVDAAVGFAADAPDETRLLMLDALAADAVASRQALAAMDRLADLLRSGRKHYEAAASLPEVTEHVLVGACSTAIYWRLLSGESLAGLEPQLIFLVLVPYVGRKAAERLTQSYS